MKTIEQTLGDKTVFKTIEWLQEHKDLLIVSASEINKIKAEAIREWVATVPYKKECGCDECRIYEDALGYANKLEQGE